MPLKLECELCGKSFPAKRSDAKHCSPACKQAAHRAAHTSDRLAMVEDGPREVFVDDWGFVHVRDAGIIRNKREGGTDVPGVTDSTFFGIGNSLKELGNSSRPEAKNPGPPPELVVCDRGWRYRDAWGELHYFSRKPDLAWLKNLAAEAGLKGAVSTARARRSLSVDRRPMKAPKRHYKGPLGLYAWPA